MSSTNNIPLTLVILNSIHTNMQAIKSYAFSHLLKSNESELEDTWHAFNEQIDLNMYDKEGVISIQAYPVVDKSVVTHEFVHIASLPTYPFSFDALEYFRHSDISELTPKEIAITNVLEHISSEIEHFKSLATPKDMVVAAELYALYVNLTPKTTH